MRYKNKSKKPDTVQVKFTIPDLLKKHGIEFINQGEYEFVIKNNPDKKTLESLLVSSIPNFKKICRIYSEKGIQYIRIMYC